MENKKEKIAAVVVTYNRKHLLKECLDALLSQTRPLDSIIVIDNASTDGTPEFLRENGYLDNSKIDYVRLPENTGGAGGFYEGVKRGYEKGYDWLWLMDDDAEPKKDALEMLTRYFNSEEISALSSLPISVEGKILHHRGEFNNFKNVLSGMAKKLTYDELQKDFLETDWVLFLGILLKKDAISKVGFPKKEFFIHYDDLEYCIRLRKVGKIFLIPKSIIIHKEIGRKDIEKVFFGRVIRRRNFKNFFIYYYNLRNLIWLGKKYSRNRLLFYLTMIKKVIKHILGIILFDDRHKIKRIKLILNAMIAGLKEDFDNNKPKEILYGK